MSLINTIRRLSHALLPVQCASCENTLDGDPVPLYATRLRDREYNQSLLLAERVSRARRLPLSYDNLIRTRDTPPQTELTRAVRLNNVRRAFAVQRPEEVAGKRILVIDDVFTTGATVDECAKTLRRAGATDVYVCTLARTV